MASQQQGRWLLAALFIAGIGSTLAAQSPDFQIVFKSRTYQRVGNSSEQLWGVSLPDLQKARMSKPPCSAFAQSDDRALTPAARAAALAAVNAGEGKHPAWSPDRQKLAYINSDSPRLIIGATTNKKNLAEISLPEPSEHWNYASSVAWSPNAKSILIGSEAGSSTAHFEDYWLLDWQTQKWQYIGGGNDARWSPDGSKILWSTKRELEPLGKMHVWVEHLVLADTRSMKQQSLTSGVTTESDFYWCGPPR